MASDYPSQMASDILTYRLAEERRRRAAGEPEGVEEGVEESEALARPTAPPSQFGTNPRVLPPFTPQPPREERSFGTNPRVISPAPPRTERGDTERREAATAAIAARDKQATREGGPQSPLGAPSPLAPGLGPVTDFTRIGQNIVNLPPMRDPEVPAVKPNPRLASTPETRPTGGIRAYRVNGKIVYTNLPGAYEGEERAGPMGYGTSGGGEAVDYRDATDETRARVATTDQGPAPVGVTGQGGGISETPERYAMVARARQAAREGPGSSTSIEPSPGGTDEFGNTLATPGYWDQLEGTLKDNIQTRQLGAIREAAGMTPRDRAELEAYVKRSGNNQLGLFEGVMGKLGQIDLELARLRELESVAQTPEEKAQVQARIKEQQTTRESAISIFALLNRQMALPGAIGAGAGDTTPES